MLLEFELIKVCCQIGMIFQYFNLFFLCIVFGNVVLLLELDNILKDEIKCCVMELLLLVGFGDKYDSYLLNFFGGQK